MRWGPALVVLVPGMDEQTLHQLVLWLNQMQPDLCSYTHNHPTPPPPPLGLLDGPSEVPPPLSTRLDGPSTVILTQNVVHSTYWCQPPTRLGSRLMLKQPSLLISLPPLPTPPIPSSLSLLPHSLLAPLPLPLHQIYYLRTLQHLSQGRPHWTADGCMREKHHRAAFTGSSYSMYQGSHSEIRMIPFWYQGSISEIYAFIVLEQIFSGQTFNPMQSSTNVYHIIGQYSVNLATKDLQQFGTTSSRSTLCT